MQRRLESKESRSNGRRAMMTAGKSEENGPKRKSESELLRMDSQIKLARLAPRLCVLAVLVVVWRLALLVQVR